jgi:hypothetical protein
MSFENEDAVITELVQYTDNDRDIYQRHTLPILTNLITKQAQGKYDSAKAIQAFMYLAEAGARKYAKEFAGDETQWHDTFPTRIRNAAATHWRDEFEAEAVQGNYDELLPKKYQKKVDTRSAADKAYHAFDVGEEVSWWGSQGTEIIGKVVKVYLGPERPHYKVRIRGTESEVLKAEFELVSETARKKFARQTKAADRRKRRSR